MRAVSLLRPLQPYRMISPASPAPVTRAHGPTGAGLGARTLPAAAAAGPRAAKRGAAGSLDAGAPRAGLDEAASRGMQSSRVAEQKPQLRGVVAQVTEPALANPHSPSSLRCAGAQPPVLAVGPAEAPPSSSVVGAQIWEAKKQVKGYK